MEIVGGMLGGAVRRQQWGNEGAGKSSGGAALSAGHKRYKAVDVRHVSAVGNEPLEGDRDRGRNTYMCCLLET